LPDIAELDTEEKSYWSLQVTVFAIRSW